MSLGRADLVSTPLLETSTQGTERNGQRARSRACFTCVNPEHHLVAARREEMRRRDRRWLLSQNVIAEHDYHAIHLRESEPLRIEGREAFCPLGASGEDHEWAETIVEESRLRTC